MVGKVMFVHARMMVVVMMTIIIPPIPNISSHSHHLLHLHHHKKTLFASFTSLLFSPSLIPCHDALAHLSPFFFIWAISKPAKASSEVDEEKRKAGERDG